MGLLQFALRRPVTILVAVLSIALCTVLAVRRMAVDIFPDLNVPVIYVAQPYGGMDPAQMEGFLISYYEYHFLYIAGIEHVESKSIQNVGLVKLFFHPGTDMSQALAQTVSYVERSRAFMPPGTVAPFIVRFDAGSVPVGYLVFSSDARSVGEVQDLALFRVRPMFSTLPGVSAPPPFGGNQRTVVIHVDPERLRAYRVSPEEVVRAVQAGNAILPSGNVRTGDLNRIAPINSVVSSINTLGDLPVRSGAGPAVYVRDLGYVDNSTDITTGYALVDGKRTVYIPVTKRSDASTLAVIEEVKNALPRFRSVIPEDIQIHLEFDQSVYVKNALRSLVQEGLLGAVLTALMVLLFLRDWRGSLIVVLTIPFALLAAVVALWGSNQTLNVMTLGGLALAVGILVDEATVAMENIHTHLARGRPVAEAVLNASAEVIFPRLLAMLCVLAVFVPSFFMTGVTRALFVPLTLSVGFAMIASYLLASTLVPVLSRSLLKPEVAHTGGAFDRLREIYAAFLGRLLRVRWLVLAGYVAVAAVVVLMLTPVLGREIFPRVDLGQMQLRLRAPAGTRIERTEVLTQQTLEAIKQAAGPDNVAITLCYIGTQPASYPVNTIHLWTSGPHEAVLRVALKPGARVRMSALEERLRETLPKKFPGTTFSFEPGDVISQIMNYGAPTPIEVVTAGPNLAADLGHAQKLMTALKEIPSLRDLQFTQPLEYPSLNVDVDRVRAGQLGVTMDQVGRALVSGTSSTRFIAPNYWRDPASGTAYQVQVEIPQPLVTTPEDVENIPAMQPGSAGPYVRDLARVSFGSVVGEYDRYNQQRMVTISANVAGEDLGRAAARVEQAIRRVGETPRGVTVTVRGQVATMRQTLGSLQIGLGLAVVVIFLLLAANFESFMLSLVVLSTIPAVLAGVVLMLLVTGTTANVQSFMGAIMALGVAVANAILLVTFAEEARRGGATPLDAALEGARTRLRPILMTSSAMIAGMVPLALALGQGSEQTAPLGRAVIGGLLAATASTLFVLPSVFAVATRRRV